MGSMMGPPGTWVPVLITMIVVVAALAAAVAAGIARGRRGGAAGPVPGERHPAPGLTAGGPATPADPLADLRERYARGEISHADFLRDLDAVVRAEQDPVPAARRTGM